MEPENMMREHLAGTTDIAPFHCEIQEYLLENPVGGRAIRRDELDRDETEDQILRCPYFRISLWGVYDRKCVRFIIRDCLTDDDVNQPFLQEVFIKSFRFPVLGTEIFEILYKKIGESYLIFPPTNSILPEEGGLEFIDCSPHFKIPIVRKQKTYDKIRFPPDLYP
jgi:hypothetical protein